MSSALLDEVYDKAFLATLDPARSDSQYHIHRIFVDIDDWSLSQQRKLQRLLAMAASHDQLDEDTIRRLRSPDPRTFWGKLNELSVAHMFYVAGVPLEFSPLGRGSKEGEFIARFPDPVFVEVKTMFPRLADAAAERHLMRLCQAASKLNFPLWVTMQIRRVPRSDPALEPFRAFLKRELPLLSKKPEGCRSLIYRDTESGLEAAITYQRTLDDGPLEVSPFSGIKELTEDQNIRFSLKKAYRQLPDDMPCLVILYSRLHFPPSPRLIRDALYGKTHWRVRVSDLKSSRGQVPAEMTRVDDGFFSRAGNSRVTAVGVVDELHEKYNTDPDLVVHYHPSPRHQIDPNWLAPITKRIELAERIKTPEGQCLRLWHPFDRPWVRWDGSEDDGSD